ncbi:MAG: hypothetical protein DHS80DRAFT_31224 [Piptocephalis tieghemiana]|nr:MAG: hypothetical protein DHS80DRAFT_31224 [Piptocephalis tieghemiana]
MHHPTASSLTWALFLLLVGLSMAQSTSAPATSAPAPSATPSASSPAPAPAPASSNSTSTPNTSASTPAQRGVGAQDPSQPRATSVTTDFGDPYKSEATTSGAANGVVGAAVVGVIFASMAW